MRLLTDYIKKLYADVATGWPRFWFDATTSDSLAVIRIATGLMLAYVHVIWLTNLAEFFGPDALIDRQTNTQIHQYDFTWTYLRFTDSLTFLTAHEILAIVASLALSIGLLARVTAPLTWFLSLMICHRATGHLFGLDQAAMMLAFGLMICPCSAKWSIDAWLRGKANETTRSGLRNWLLPADSPSSMNTFATRLIQLQLCAMYLFGGLGKMRGASWWDGTAMWYSAASLEYQSFDLTWIGNHPIIAGMLCHATIFWETFYCIAIWPKRFRPIVLAIAVAVHASIAIFLGMITFGLIMIIANIIFIPPFFMRQICPSGWRSPSPAASDSSLQNDPVLQ